MARNQIRKKGTLSAAASVQAIIIHISSTDYEKRCARFSTRRRSTSHTFTITSRFDSDTTRRITQRELYRFLFSFERANLGVSSLFSVFVCLFFFLNRRHSHVPLRALYSNFARYACLAILIKLVSINDGKH